MNDGLGFKNIIEWKLFSEDGILKDSGLIENQVQTLVKEMVIDALDTGTLTSAIQGMAIGTGTGASVASLTLMSRVSERDITTTQTQPTSTSLQHIGSFSSVATATITEAGLFPNTGCTTNMFFYNGALSIAITPTDTLQITWTVNCTG